MSMSMKLADLFKRKTPSPVYNIKRKPSNYSSLDNSEMLMADAALGSDVGMLDIDPHGFESADEVVNQEPPVSSDEDEGLSHAHARYFSPQREEAFEVEGKHDPQFGRQLQSQHVGGHIPEPEEEIEHHHYQEPKNPNKGLINDLLPDNPDYAVLDPLIPLSPINPTEIDESQYINPFDAEEMGLPWPVNFENDSSQEGNPFSRHKGKIALGLGLGLTGAGLAAAAPLIKKRLKKSVKSSVKKELKSDVNKWIKKKTGVKGK